VSEVAEPSAVHLRRDAYIYVRQSTLAQVSRNTESLHRQYDLSGRAKALGWAGNQIVVIDDDLGRSGSSAAGRRGFAELVADVGLGRAGIILSLEVSRQAQEQHRLVPAAGSVCPDRHADRRRRWRLSSCRGK
jgi:DNA invertase Pin-like site-specific DNA recombinase